MTDPVRVVAAGDPFVPSSLIARAVGDELGDRPLDLRQLEPGPARDGAEEELIEALAGARVLVTRSGPVTDRVLDACPGLGLVAVCGSRPAGVDLDAAKIRDVRVCHAPGCDAAATAEHTLGLMLAVLRRVPWAGTETPAYERAGLELEDLPVGLIGHGAVGDRVARVLCAFGAQVMVYDPYVRGEIHGLRVSSLDDLLARSRVITLHAGDGPGTRGLIGARELALLPPGAVVVNTARGPLLDEGALCDALESGRVSAAALDTGGGETGPDHARLLGLADRVVLTPRLGGATRAAARKAARTAAEEVGRWLRGQPPAHGLT
ncbi:NAD(P)-dependent oxidoreductase [Streptomyces sp. HMX87]|uniref:NAD(P)-dependent oxidoreductase n=1 Tax=Streptomyces sp. HMX87 TaxID=3390849 RepID=UPI003A89D98B